MKMTLSDRTLLELKHDGAIPPAVSVSPPQPMSPEQRAAKRPTHTVDDGRSFWLFATRAEADAFAAFQANRHRGRVYTVSELKTCGSYGRHPE